MLRIPKRLLALLLAATAALWLFGERGRLLLPSSLRMMRAGGKRQFLNGLHGYVYGRWTNQYINVLIHHVTPRLGENGKKWLSDRYHGKVLTHDQAESIVNLEHDIPLTDLEQIVPYPIARSIVLNAPPDIAAYECSCRHARANPCQPTQVCMVVGREPVDFILEHNPQSSRRLSREEALQILKEEHERGHMHSAWFKDAILDRFYVICNCCKCCCGGIEAMMKHGVPMLASSGYVANIDEAACNGCGICVELCPFDALSLERDLASVKWESCMGCGVCTGQCPLDAVSLVRDELKGIPLEVALLTAGRRE